MTGKQLKNAILQLAIQGKLVAQDPSDEPVSALLARIRKEKEQLVKAGKLKKKDLETTPIADDEKPFEIPESWEWVRLGFVINLLSGQDLTPDRYFDTEKGIPYITGASHFDNGNLKISRWTETPTSVSKKGDLLITCKGTVGTMAYNNIGDIHIARQVMAISPIKIHLPYINVFLEFFVPELEKQAHSIIPGISREILLSAVVPIPPLAEQRRIVAKIEELMPLVEEFGAAQEKLDRLNGTLPEALKKSILQQAIQGKLVPQDTTDEPASALLARIRKEKEQLVKAGKIALSKPEKKFKEKLEFPFEIPNSWTWCSLYDVCRVFGRIGFRGYTKEDLVKYKEDGAITISPTNIINGELDFSICTYLSEDKYNESPEIMVEVGDILLVKTASCGKTALVNELPWKATINPQIALLKDIMINREYLSLLLKSPYIQSKIHDFTIGTSIPTFSQEIMLTLNIPLPPLAEQQRIVARVEELLAMVDGMK